MKKILLCLFFFSICTSWAQDKLVVHEWGTFTSLQDEQGNAIGGINTDDEPVPSFVHRLAYYLLLRPGTENQNLMKGITPKCHMDVTMRLETPVIYFYPPAGWKSQPVDVHVGFPGGWLSEYYPDAIFKAPGFDSAHPDKTYSNESGTQSFKGFGHIKPDAVGELSWKGLTIGVEGTGPETDQKVWLAPRDVKAATVKTTGGESEKFLFYRGVGNVNAWLRIERNNKDGNLQPQVNDNKVDGDSPHSLEELQIPSAWLVDVQPDGTCAFKSLGKVEWNSKPVMPASFDPKEFSAGNMTALQDEMNKALINAGLFSDEAAALLKTWQVSYFKNPGLRFFYLCPREDINNTLPLEISAPSVVTRVMIGRIEIVTPEQRELLAKIAAAPQLSDYTKLGRFRNALILDEQKRHPTPALDDFIQKNNLEAYKIE